MLLLSAPMHTQSYFHQKQKKQKNTQAAIAEIPILEIRPTPFWRCINKMAGRWEFVSKDPAWERQECWPHRRKPLWPMQISPTARDMREHLPGQMQLGTWWCQINQSREPGSYQNPFCIQTEPNYQWILHLRIWLNAGPRDPYWVRLGPYLINLKPLKVSRVRW